MNSHSHLRFAIYFAFLIIVVCVIPGRSAFAKNQLLTADAEAGRLIYLKGFSITSQPIEAFINQDVKVSGPEFACVKCHRLSGMGSSEGGKYVLPVTGPILFAPRELNRNRIFSKLFHEIRSPEFVNRMRQPRMRPAYTDESLARAIRSGIDPADYTFDSVMPRYNLTDQDMANLIAYLKTLSVEHDPGIDSKTVHIATIVNDSSDPAARDAVLKTIRGYFDWFNLALANDLSKGNFSTYNHSDFVDSYRRWQLHVWTLHGTPDTWAEQLAKAYKDQPVFAVAGGFVNGPWSPIAQFCDRKRIPCLFPNTDLPQTTDDENAYSFYFSRGLELEAEVLARYLDEKSPVPQSMVQISFTDPYGRIPAQAFATAVNQRIPSHRLESIEVSSKAAFAETIDRINARHGDIDALVIWPGEHAPEVISVLNKHLPDIGVIALASNALDSWQKQGNQSDRDSERVIFTYPYELPTAYHPRAFRVRAWMRSNRIEVTHSLLQFQTYYMLTLLDYGMRSLRGDFFRDYFNELIESEAESNLNNGTHPTLGLGPGQRFASKGAYIVVPDQKNKVRAISRWIIP